MLTSVRLGGPWCFTRSGRRRQSRGSLPKDPERLEWEPESAAFSTWRVPMPVHRASLLVARRALRVRASATPAVAPQERKAGVSELQPSKGLIDTNPPRGTRDFPPEEFRLRQWLFAEFEAVSRLFGFEQFETPVLESEELFTRKAGEEITQQLYNFEDKGRRRVALRPELTPSLARLVLGAGAQQGLPLKWFTIGQCWRYERMTRGRKREHYQWNMDIVGVAGIAAEAELLAALAAFLRRVGLGPADVAIKVSSRKVLQAVLDGCGVPAVAFGPVCVVVDKADKLPRDKVREELLDLGLTPDAAERVLAATELRSLDALEAVAGPGSEAVVELKELWALAEASGCAEFLEFDAACVRGLAYYTGIVFEGRDRAGALRAIFGGGRYDGLLATFGGEARPCAGFGFGDCVIMELLAERGLLPQLGHRVDDVVHAVDEALRPAAAGLAARLRSAGRIVDLVLEPRKMKWVFKQAEKCGASRLLLVAPDEWARGAVRVKDLATREEADVPLADFA